MKWCLVCTINTADHVTPYVTAETQRISSSQQHPHLRKVSVSESNVLLDEEVLTDPKIQALLLTVLVRFFFQSLRKSLNIENIKGKLSSASQNR